MLMTLYAQPKHVDDAIICGQRILACDPMRETVQRALMVLCVLNAQRGEAIRQFERCTKALREECDVDPAPKTCLLIKLIRSGDVYDKLSVLLEQHFAVWIDTASPLLSW